MDELVMKIERDKVLDKIDALRKMVERMELVDAIEMASFVDENVYELYNKYNAQ